MNELTASTAATTTAFDAVLWVGLPYVAIAVFIVGHIWRWRYDQFGWTTRSSQVYETRLLRWASPLFHYGILAVLLGHIVGLLVPREWLYAIGISEELYHWGAASIGTLAAAATIVGLAVLIFRRRTTERVFLATSVMDKIMYLFLAVSIVFGTLATLVHQVFGPGFHYRETISPWVRSILMFQPQPQLMVDVPLLFKIHVVTATVLFILWPFTRLVHAFSAPFGYIFRPYIVYRSRDAHRGSRAVRRGWEAIEHPTSTSTSTSTSGRSRARR